MRCAGALGGLNGALLAGYFRGANVDIGNEYLLASIAVVVIGGTSVAGGKANVPGVWGAALFLVLLLTMLNTFGVSAGVRLLLTGLIIVGVITAAGDPKTKPAHRITAPPRRLPSDLSQPGMRRQNCAHKAVTVPRLSLFYLII